MILLSICFLLLHLSQIRAHPSSILDNDDITTGQERIGMGDQRISLKETNQKAKIDETKVDLMDNPKSCQEVKMKDSSSPSGYYQFTVNGMRFSVYCHMGELCNIPGPWTRLAYLNMTDAQSSCPQALKLYQEGPVRACGRKKGPGCGSVVFPSHKLRYSKVCGHVLGYQYGTTDAFYKNTNSAMNEIDDAYVDGVSITRGYPPRKHIWTFAAGLSDKHSLRKGNSACPCASDSRQKAPSFVNNDYYCESGSSETRLLSKLFVNDVLWDGKGCSYREQNCCNKGGWFFKDFGKKISDRFELRVCSDQETSNEDAPVSLYQIFVK